jgi:hypothetical protein
VRRRLRCWRVIEIHGHNISPDTRVYITRWRAERRRRRLARQALTVVPALKRYALRYEVSREGSAC